MPAMPLRSSEDRALGAEGPRLGSASSSSLPTGRSSLSSQRAASTPALGLVSHNSPVLSNIGTCCIYARTSGAYGSRIPKLQPPRFGLSNRFSSKVAEAGMPRPTKMKTEMQGHSRYIAGAMDWTQKITM
mmetsp:Transcript_52469/g.147281  ORF Transcript_52469/g.147281 Transcript_52469/m.147281 type:complete len:130 (+) Transcript_52469:143-532(+)|eukprot:CAMPEP_0176263512 /NCGR_PEP_ID=MMETSP0121_2-20121125/41162_1 /TAXON_ID=160619 /ORGANISM="Kryptoperidinium foliaceum, Strain CCMP 1326" /LENGTH=129 /DNA_ID=CAMNT_0017603507 /DNA_START=123 /DNA_END=512 /DNA_ORIENTATION=-